MRARDDVRCLRVRWRRTQAFRLDRPEDRTQAPRAEQGKHRGVDHAPRGTEEAWRRSAEGRERLLRAIDLVGSPAWPAQPQASMRPAVARHLVTTGHDRAHGLGRTRRTLSDEEERSAYAPLGERV